MIVTEEEAKEKWCPYATGCKDINPQLTRKCIGSECMWWRWYITVSNISIPPKHGYCGAVKD